MRSDVELVARSALNGDKDAFGILVERYQSPIRRFLLNVSGNEELAKDLTQETFIKAWLGIGSFRAVAKFSTWLYRIAYNTFYDYNTRQHEKLLGDGDINDVCSSHSDYENVDFDIDFKTIISSLDENERAVMLLYFMEDFTIDKISTILNMPKGTVKSHLHRAKKYVETQLTENKGTYKNSPRK
ncbi:MAG: RNA polymerase sigma factor [bacterium]